MLTRAEFISPQGEVLSLPLSDTSNGYLVKDIEGLDPVKATLVSSDMAQVDGASPQASSLPTRNITMKIGLRPNYATMNARALRTALYNWFMPKQVITVNFYEDDALFVTSVGTVESCENSMFSQDQEVDISLIHYDPAFYAADVMTVDGDTVLDSTIQTVTYPGTADCGVIFTLTISTAITGFTITNTRPDGVVQSYQVTGNFAVGDVITITSIPRQKSLMLLRAGLNSSVLYYLQPSSTWITLNRGDNDIRFFDAVGGNAFTLAYTAKYGGL